MRFAVGTTNKAKVACVVSTAEAIFSGTTIQVDAFEVASGVSSQPMSAAECQKGALQRATEALEKSVVGKGGEVCPAADFGVGLEGGVEKIGDRWFECGWMCVIERSTGRVGWGSSARFEMSQKIMHKIVNEGKELAEVMDELTGESDVRSNLGAMGILTAGHLGRAEAYRHGLLFAFAPFLSDRETYWDD